MPHLRCLFLSCAVLASMLFAAPAPAATWSVEADVSVERETELTDEGRKVKTTREQAYNIKYDKQLNPAFKFSLDLTLDVTDEFNKGPPSTSSFDTSEVKPSAEAKLQALWWDLTASIERDQKTSKDPAQEPTTDTTWDLEYTTQFKKGDLLPEAKVKLERDRTVEGGKTQNTERIIETTVDYKLWKLLDIAIDGKRDFTNEELQSDQDKEDRDVKVDAKVTHEFLKDLKFEAEATNERHQILTLSGADDVVKREDTLDNDVKAQLTYNILEDLKLTLDREIEWKKDLELGPLEVADTWTGEADYTHSFSDTLAADLNYNDERKDTRGTLADSYKITREYSGGLKFDPLKNLSLKPTFDRTADTEWFRDPTKPKEKTIDDKLEVEMDTKFWRDQIELKATRTLQSTRENGLHTANEKDWDVEFDIIWKNMPNLEFKPKYTFTETNDLFKEVVDTEKEIDVELKYVIDLKKVLQFSIDHKYTRTSKSPGDTISTIERKDDSEFKVTWSDFLQGMSLELTLGREASDESMDDKPPEIDYIYEVKHDYEFMNNYTLSSEYKYDEKGLQPDARNLLTKLSADFFKKAMTISLEYEIEQQLEEDIKTIHRYLIELEGKL